jgi:hypothetical protein
MKCDNCSNDAVYTHAEPGVSSAHYCNNCLPHWLSERAIAGHFPLLTPAVDDPEPVVAKSSKKKTVAPAEVTPAEESAPSENN